MADDDFSSIPLIDRWVHKSWKARKSAYEEAAKHFEFDADEPETYQPFLFDPGLWKSAAADPNVAAQQEALAALCVFLRFGGREACVRTRGQTVVGLVEKGLPSTRSAIKASALEALLLYIELDVAAPIIDDMLPTLSHKQPKIIAATLAALTQIYHNYGCKIIDPKPVLKLLPKVFGHADKNVRAETTNLAVEFYRWLQEAMKVTFWNDLKPTQQSDLESQFEKIKAEPPPRQERLLRSQQAALAREAQSGGAVYDEGEMEADEPGEVDAFDLAEPQDVLGKIPGDFYTSLASSKWKERKEALDSLYQIINVPRIKDRDVSELMRGLAKCMKDANIAVVTQAATCIQLLAKGLRSGFQKHRATITQPIIERLKEKKQTVADALGAALDEVFLATSLSDCLEDIAAFLVHKNPQVKEGTVKFLIRCLRTTPVVPSKPEIATIVEGAKKLLAESSEGLRSGGAEVLGTVMKILGERAMTPHLEGLDDIRKAKIKEFYETAEVKAKEKPKSMAAAASRGPQGGPAKKAAGLSALKGPAGLKKPSTAGASAAASAAAADSAPLASQQTSRPGLSKLGMAKPGLKAPQKRRLGGPSSASPARRPIAAVPPPPPPEEEDLSSSPPPPPLKTAPRLGLSRGGLAGRSLAKPSTGPPPAPPALSESPTPSLGLTHLERAELEELRSANERLLRQLDEGRQERAKLMSELAELKTQNASLIEEHTRDLLSIKAKETQLMHARSDWEAADQTNDRLRRELDRLKRALAKAEQQQQHQAPVSPIQSLASPTYDDPPGMYRDGGGAYSSARSRSRNRMSMASTLSEEKENGGAGAGADSHHAMYARNKFSPELRYAGSAGGGSSGRGSPARGDLRRSAEIPTAAMYSVYAGDRTSRTMGGDVGNGGGGAGAMQQGNGNSQESWKRAAEVTSQLKARIEQMKAKQRSSRP